MQDAMFLIPTPQVLQKIITGRDDLYEHDIKNLDYARRPLRVYAESSIEANDIPDNIARFHNLEGD